MITKQELEKMIVKESQAFEKYDYGNSQEEQEDAFKEGALFMQGILMPEVERLKNSEAEGDFIIDGLKHELSALTAKLKRYEEALLFYANQDNWIGYHRDCTNILNDDVKAKAKEDGFDIIIGGKRARATLNQKDDT